MRLRIIGCTEAILQARAGPRTWVQHSSGEGLNLSDPPCEEGVTPSQPLIERAVQVT